MTAMIYCKRLAEGNRRLICRGERAYAVPEPVRRGRQTDSARADRERENLANDDPGSGAPGGGKEEDVYTDEGNHGLDSFRVRAINRARNGDDELADDHTGRAPDQNGASAESLDNVERDWRGANVDQGGNKIDQERIADRSELLEESGSEVKDEIDTSPLLHHL
jgi:hypothetical protein